MIIRKATINDLKAITAVESECFPKNEAATEEDFKGRLEVYPNHFWLLEDNDILIGFVNGMVTDEALLSDEMYENHNMHNEDGKWQMIFGVDIISEYRRQGLAEKIIREVINDAKGHGREGIVLTCKEKLIHYYEKFGFENEGISKSVHGGVVWYDMRLRFK